MLLFGRLMERNTKHHSVTYSLTLRSIEFLLDGVMQIGCLNYSQLLYPQLVGLLVWLRCVFVVYMNDCIMSWTGIFLWSSKNWFVISQNVYVCLMFLAWSHEHTVRPITGWFARNQSMIFSPSLNWGGVFLSVPAFLYIMSNIYISLNFKCCQE